VNTFKPTISYAQTHSVSSPLRIAGKESYEARKRTDESFSATLLISSPFKRKPDHYKRVMIGPRATRLLSRFAQQMRIASNPYLNPKFSSAQLAGATNPTEHCAWHRLRLELLNSRKIRSRLGLSCRLLAVGSYRHPNRHVMRAQVRFGCRVETTATSTSGIF
jgi:hypothetical protein